MKLLAVMSRQQSRFDVDAADDMELHPVKLAMVEPAIRNANQRIMLPYRRTAVILE